MNKGRNVILIGMPGVGKSTVGVLLAKRMGRYFLDTDIYIQTVEGKYLQKIIDEQGLEAFCEIEEKHLLCLDCVNAVIATGGSAVYSDKAIGYLKENGLAVHLDLGLAEIERRVTDIGTRGVVMEPGETLASLYEKRSPLYRKYADVTIDSNGKSVEDTVAAIMSAIE
jgi:shikimate kinase